MIIDKNLVMADAQAVTTDAATTDYIDTLAAGIAYGTECWLEVLVDTAATASGAATVVFTLQGDSSSAFGSAVTLVASGAIAKTTLIAGYRPLVVKIPLGCPRYIRGYHTIATGPLTAGKFDWRVVLDVFNRIP
jgi:hypothetical protein